MSDLKLSDLKFVPEPSVSHLLDSESQNLAQTPLYDLHLKLGARMVPFAGFSMPVQYPAGILSEHLHTRQHAGLFDVSHMGQAIAQGHQAASLLEKLVPGDLKSLDAGQMRYSQLLDQNGHILDDLMLTKLAPEGGQERFFLVVNAAAKVADFAHIASALPNLTLNPFPDRALLALQGPEAVNCLGRRLPQVTGMPFMSMIFTTLDGVELFISRSGYTGEDGFEISVPSFAAEAFARDLLSHEECWPIGLGARDSLRLEAGLCLYGHDIDQTTDPIEAGLLWSISKRRRTEGGFLGDGIILRTIAEGPKRRRVGLILEGKAPAREGAEITTLKGERIGQLTSGGFSPSLNRPIAMGYVEAGHAAIGASVFIVVRGKPLKADITALPFVTHNYKRGI
jgi:aminomethyltransferase